MTYPWLSLARTKRHEEQARRLGVSQVARSSRGFLREYERAGTADAMKKRKVPGYPNQTWGRRRDAFIARHLPLYRRHPTARRRYALRMWAYAL